MNPNERIEHWCRVLGVGPRRIDPAREFFRRIYIDGEDTLDVADNCDNIFLRVSKAHWSNLVWLICSVAARGPLVRGRAIQRGWTTGNFDSILGAYTRTLLVSWFRQGSPTTMMSDAERDVFDRLPAVVSAWRGSSRTDPAQACRGLSWTLDPNVAKKFAAFFGGIVVRADIPRSAVLAYFDRRSEKEIVVDFRAVRSAQFVAHVPPCFTEAKFETICS
jgi:hypothetical protein